MELGPRSRVMGIVNVTPDSFSDGGRFDSVQQVVDTASRMVQAGADLLDIGGESTRPGATPVEATQESDRVLPIIESLTRDVDVRLSIDTRRADVARQALDAGAAIVNDVSSLADPGMLPLIVDRRVPVVLMHMRGKPETMQRSTHYDDVVGEVTDYLRERVAYAVAGGVSSDKIVVDPGIGFGKGLAGNLEVLRQLTSLRELGHPILIGASRKAFIGEILDTPVTERLVGSLAVAVWAATHGAHIVRAHDVAETVRALRVIDALRG
ncbi:MAG: dihydropteroate synthase [Acidobacteriota bacterium]|nr:dihydropteroate synthase [Acidobacteriota bacterium]